MEYEYTPIEILIPDYPRIAEYLRLLGITSIEGLANLGAIANSYLVKAGKAQPANAEN